MNVNYYLDAIDLKQYSVFVSASEGLLSKPKFKQPVGAAWTTYHGEVIDLEKRYYESREINLICFIKSETNAEFIQACNEFISLFEKSGTSRLAVTVDGSEPLVYEVFLNSSIEIKKTWSESNMIGTFNINLKEPEPVKRVIKFQGSGTVSITVTSTKLLNFYWGDGSHTFDVSGTAQTITHSFSSNGIFYIVVTGNIDEITSLTTNGTIVWNKL